MILSYFGDGGFRLQSGDLSLLVDPPNNRLKADVVLRTLVSTEMTAPEVGEIAFPGEYEVRGIEISGIGVIDESTDKYLKTVYLVRWDEMSFAFLGHVKNVPSIDILEGLNEPNILFLPVGGGHFMSPQDAAKVAKKIEPNLIVPAFYKTPTDFLKAMGQKGREEEKLVFKKKDIITDTGKVLILKTNN